MFSSRRRPLAVLPAVGAALALWLGLTAPAADAAGLTGETFVADHYTPGAICDFATGNGTVSFTAAGTAAGPYPGTFNETGTETAMGNRLTAFSATFSITNSAGAVTVSGTKTLPAPSSADFISCLGATDITATDLTYSAMTPDCSPDQGTSTLSASGPSDNLGTFNEEFTSTNCAPVMPASKCQTRDGRRDTQEAQRGQADRDGKGCPDASGS